MISTSAIKSACMSWFRFGRQMPYVADEVAIGSWLADVVGASEESFIELEVKISLADLRRDFSSKSTKHWMYRENALDTNRVIPNKVYFVIPRDFAEEANHLLHAAADPYGLLLYEQPNYDTRQVPWTNLSVLRRAKALHARPTPARFLDTMAKRMSSDLCHFHMTRHRYGDLFEQMREASRTLCNPPKETIEI